MKIEFFDVEHGACALITDDQNQRIMVDCGHNSTTGWMPGNYLSSIGVAYLETLWITNYDEDHVSGINNLLDKVQVGFIGRNTQISPALIAYLKRHNTPGPGIARLIKELNENRLPPGVLVPGTAAPQFLGISLRTFWNAYPQFEDENNLSVVMRVSCHGTTIMFTGDMERAGWNALLQRADFRTALNNVDIFVASHHGREDGYCEEMFQYFGPNCPRFVVVSDKSIVHDTQKTGAWYADKAAGGIFNGEANRRFITTRSDGSLIVVPNPLDNTYVFAKRI
jgi:beta-lactamase superfamily II metal-dependent hydrolase